MHQRIDLTNLIKTPEQISEMTKKLIAGDKSMINPLIEAHIELTYKIAGKFIGKTVDKSPDKKDSIIAQALYELTRAVNNAANGILYDEHITKYIASCIHGYLQRFLALDRLIPIEPSAFKQMAEKGRLFEFLPVTYLLNDDIDQYETDEEESFHPDAQTSWMHGVSNYNDAAAELLDAINTINWCENHRAIITGILEGKTYEEIGVPFGYSKQSVVYHINAIRRRVYEVIGTVPAV